MSRGLQRYKMFSDFGQQLEDTVLSRRVGDAYKATPEEILDEDYNVGTTRRYKFGGTVQDQPFTPDELQQARMGLAADAYARAGRPEQAIGLRTKGQQLKLMGTQQKAAEQNLELGAVNLKGAKRKSDEDEREQEAFTFLRSINHLPEPQKMQEIAKFASKFVPDGVNFGVDFDENVGYQMVAVGPNGSVSRKPVTDSKQLEREVLMYVSPKMHQQVRTEERQDRTDRRLEDALGETRQYHQGMLTRYDEDRTARVDQANADRTSRDRHYRAMEGIAGQRAANAGASRVDRLPERERIYINALERQEQALMAQLSKVEDPAQSARITQELRTLRNDQFDFYQQHGLLPDGASKVKYLGLPDPIQVAHQVMRGARNDREMLASLEQFDSIYGNAPEAGQARAALQQFYDNKWGSNARAGRAGGGMAAPAYTPRQPGIGENPGGAATGLMLRR